MDQALSRTTSTLAPPPAPTPGWGLGLDGGGTATRWALAAPGGSIAAEGQVAGISGLQLADAAGRDSMARTMAALAADVQRLAPGRAAASMVAGLTGFASDDGADGTEGAALQALLAAPFGLPVACVQAMSDIELACRAAFAPGQGAVLYAGTGSIAAFLAADGTLHRAGGRGAVIDDAGGGHWIAREALRLIWRAEDAAPGAGAHSVNRAESALGRQVFAAVGGSAWADTRAWVYGASRGELGTLALAVAAAAREGNAPALALLQQAGQELARLANCLHQRFGPLPLALAGRVFELHPAIEASLLAALPAGTIIHRLAMPAHHQAAVLAAARGSS